MAHHNDGSEVTGDKFCFSGESRLKLVWHQSSEKTQTVGPRPAVIHLKKHIMETPVLPFMGVLKFTRVSTSRFPE